MTWCVVSVIKAVLLCHAKAIKGSNYVFLMWAVTANFALQNTAAKAHMCLSQAKNRSMRIKYPASRDVAITLGQRCINVFSGTSYINQIHASDISCNTKLAVTPDLCTRFRSFLCCFVFV